MNGGVEQLTRALAAISATEWLAVVLALAYLVLAVGQNAWCWLFAALSSVLYLWLFAAAGLRMQAALQVFYIAMAGYGWLAWHRGRRAGAEPDGNARSRSAEGMAVSRWSPRRHLAAVGLVVVVTCINAALLRAAPSPAEAGAAEWVPYADAAIAWGSVLTTWMVARKVLENWLYWIVLDLAAAWLYGSQGLYATAVLFVVYAVIAARGYRSWRDSIAAVPLTPAADA